MPQSDREFTSRREAFGTLAEVVADAMLEAEAGTLIRVEDEDGTVHLFYVGTWGEA